MGCLIVLTILALSVILVPIILMALCIGAILWFIFAIFAAIFNVPITTGGNNDDQWKDY